MSEDRPVGPPRRSRFLLAIMSLLLAGLVVFVSLLALGILEVRRAGRSVEKPTDSELGASQQAVIAQQSALNARVTSVTSSSPLMPFVDRSGHCFKYEGAWVECWIEIEENNQKTVVAEIRENLTIQGKNVDNHDLNNLLKGKPPSGYIAWVSRSEGDQKVWYLYASVIDPETGRAFVNGTSGSKPKAQLIQAPYYETVSPRELLQAGKDVVLVTRIEYVGEKVVRTARLVCRVLE